MAHEFCKSFFVFPTLFKMKANPTPFIGHLLLCLSTVACSTLFITPAAAQKLQEWRAYSGINLSLLGGKGEPFEDVRRLKAGLAFGLGASLKMAEKLDLELMFAYENKGRLLDFPTPTDRVRANYHYLIFSAVAERKLVKGSDKLFIGAGLYCGYLLRQQSVFADRDPPGSQNNTYFLRRYDFGPLVTARWDFLSYGKLDIFLQSRAAFGLVNINKGAFPPDTVLRNRSLVLALGAQLRK
jgi:hypothetical protein